MEIRLIRPEAEHEEAVLAFRQEFFDNGETVINGSEQLDSISSYGEWLQMIKACADRERLRPDRVLTDTFLAADEAGNIIGIIDLRHELKGFLADFGHCGYSVRPVERQKGYATRMLALILHEAKAAGLTSLQLSVERKNTPSVKTILKNGGVYERTFTWEGEPADVYRIML